MGIGFLKAAPIKVSEAARRIPSVSALEVHQSGGQAAGLQAEANVVTVNFTPADRRKKLTFGCGSWWFPTEPRSLHDESACVVSRISEQDSLSVRYPSVRAEKDRMVPGQVFDQVTSLIDLLRVTARTSGHCVEARRCRHTAQRKGRMNTEHRRFMPRESVAPHSSIAGQEPRNFRDGPA